jgi:hypothetical protein
MKLIFSYLFMASSDLYRIIASIMDWRCHIRVLSGKGKYDVAFINNLENDLQKQFLGVFHKNKAIAYSLRFSLGRSLCRSLLINCSAHELAKPKSRQIAKHYTRIAITTAVRDGARIILFAAGTKRLFSEEELAEISKDYPNVVFTIGDNGTALALLADVLYAIKLRKLKPDSNIAILGPNGFLGEATSKFLKELGYNNLLLLSSNMDSPFAKVSDVELVVACSHYVRLKLTADILNRISCVKGIYVIDVCRPANLSKKEFVKCLNVVRQDSGMVHNTRIKYVFPLGALFVLRRLGLSTRIMYGCFGEAVALSVLPQEKLKDFDFLSVNINAMQFMEQAFTLAYFVASPAHNFGQAASAVIPTAEWDIAKHL